VCLIIIWWFMISNSVSGWKAPQVGECVCVCVSLFNVRADHVIRSRVLRPYRGKGRRGRKAPGFLSSVTSYKCFTSDLHAVAGFT